MHTIYEGNYSVIKLPPIGNNKAKKELTNIKHS